MTNNSGPPLLAPQTFSFVDVDEFRSSVRHLRVDFTPLVRTIAAEQTILNLPGCSVNLIRSFPRITDGQLAPDCTAVGFTMDEGIPIRFDGVDEDRPAIVIGTHEAVYTTVERVGREYASIIFTPQVEDRGWPEAMGYFRIFETSAAAHERLRILVREILSHVSASTDEEVAQAAASVRESLMSAIDAGFAAIVPETWVARANTFRQYKIFLDARDMLAASIGRPVYSNELAKQLGVSVRTLHDAVLRYSGVSLHRYLRLRRLWLVRRRLHEGAHSVKATALAFGFWHFGDFSQSYRTLFGETPSETLGRARGG